MFMKNDDVNEVVRFKGWWVREGRCYLENNIDIFG